MSSEKVVWLVFVFFMNIVEACFRKAFTIYKYKPYCNMELNTKLSSRIILLKSIKV
jgi:hypothetical protein